MSILLRLCFSLLLLAPALVHAATLENPANGLNYSGIGVISGWKCTAAGPLTVRFNGGDAIPLAYGNARADVRDAGACPSAQVGFVSIMNWAELGDGTHTAVAYDNGVEFARSTFEVMTLGTSFLQGASRGVTVFDFPELGTDVVLQWQPALQNFVITDRVESPSGSPFGSRFYWAQTTYNTEPGVTDTVYWARTDGSATGSISAAVDSRPIAGGRIIDLAIDSVEDKLYLLTYTPRAHEGGDGGAIHRVNLDGTEYEEIWVYETSIQYAAVTVGEISVGMGDIYLTIWGVHPQAGVHNLRRLNIADVLSHPADDPPKTVLQLPGTSSSSPDITGYDLEKVYDASQLTSLFDGYGLPTDIHVTNDTMYFIIEAIS